MKEEKIKTKQEEDEKEKEKEESVNTPYDDVFRTLITYGGRMTIPFINEMFGKHIPENVKMTTLQNEMYIASGSKRITDSQLLFEGTETLDIGEDAGLYHTECESLAGDAAILFKLFEYDSGSALKQAVLDGNTLHVSFPRTGVLFLRDTKNTPDRMQMMIEDQNTGQELALDVPVMKMSNYTLDEIFEKKLLFLLPFYIFNYEKPLKSEVEDKVKKTEQAVLDMIRDIREKIEELAETGELNAYSFAILEEAISKVAVNLAEKSDKIKEGVMKIMGGQIYKPKAQEILEQGIELGDRQGFERGDKQGYERGSKEGQNILASAIHDLKSGKTAEDLRGSGVDEATIQCALTCL